MNELPTEQSTTDPATPDPATTDPATPDDGGAAAAASPGTPRALRDGCRCSVLLNQAVGQGGPGDHPGFVNPLCPVHGSLGSDRDPDQSADPSAADHSAADHSAADQSAADLPRRS
jgi:hypothetical protein